MIYDLVACPHRVTMDIHADPTRRDEINAFVELLWEKGSNYEAEVMAGLDAPFADLSSVGGDETGFTAGDANQCVNGRFAARGRESTA